MVGLVVAEEEVDEEVDEEVVEEVDVGEEDSVVAEEEVSEAEAGDVVAISDLFVCSHDFVMIPLFFPNLNACCLCFQPIYLSAGLGYEWC